MGITLIIIDDTVLNRALPGTIAFFITDKFQHPLSIVQQEDFFKVIVVVAQVPQLLAEHFTWEDIAEGIHHYHPLSCMTLIYPFFRFKCLEDLSSRKNREYIKETFDKPIPLLIHIVFDISHQPFIFPCIYVLYNRISGISPDIVDIILIYVHLIFNISVYINDLILIVAAECSSGKDPQIVVSLPEGVEIYP